MSVARAGAVYAVANLASASVPFLLLPLMTRALTPSDYGAVVNFFLLVTASSALAGMSVHGAVGVAWFRERGPRLPAFIGSALLVGMLSTLLVAALLAGLLWLVGESLAVPPAWGGGAALAAGTNVLLQCRLVLWQNQRRPVAVATVQVAGALLNVGLSLIAVLLLGWGGEGRNAGAAVAACAMAAFAAVSLLGGGEARLVWNADHVRSLLRFGMPLVPHAAAGVLLASADRFIVSAELGASALGVYGAVAQLGTVMAILADAFVKAYNPWLYERLAAHDLRDSLAVVGAVYASVPGFLLLGAVVGAALFAASHWLLGPAYRDGARLLPWFVLGGAFSGVYLALSGLYFFAGRTALLSAVTLPCALVGTAIIVLLVQLEGTTGAAIGHAAAQALLAAATWLVASRSFDLPWRQASLALRTWWGQALAPVQRIAR